MTRSNIATIISQHHQATDDNLAANELFSISRKHSILVPTATPSSSSQDQLQQPFYHSHRSTLTQSVHNKPRRDSLPPTSSSSNIHNQLPRRSSNNNHNAYRMASSSGSANRPRAASQSQQTTTTTTTTIAADQPPTPISITICGDGGCGKSSITLRLVRSQWTSEYDPTIEDSYSVTRRVDGAAYHLALTDTAGQEEYRGMWASSNLGADAFLMVYDITSPASLEALGYFDELIDMEAETRMDNAQRARRAGVTPGPEYDYNGGGVGGGGGAGSSGKTVAPVKFVAGNKCDLQESRMVSAATGLDWARKRGCGFMETSARNEVNIEETFALIVRRVVEARRLAAMGDAADEEERAGNGSRGATKPLSPLPGSEAMSEKMGARGPDNSKAGKVGRGGGGFWKKLRCW